MRNNSGGFLLSLSLSLGAFTFGCSSELSDVEAVDTTALNVLSSTNGDGVEESSAGDELPPVILGSCEIDAARDYLKERFDRDSDGAITGEERDRMEGEHGEFGGRGGRRGEGRGPGGPMMHHLVRIYDADESRSLDETERAELEADLEARCEAKKTALLAEFDADGSGELEDAELEAARAAIEAKREAHREEILAASDADGDGELSEEEREAAREARRDEMEAARATLEAEFDLDESGDLDEAEKEALVESLKAKVRSGEPLGPRH